MRKLIIAVVGLSIAFTGTAHAMTSWKEFRVDHWRQRGHAVSSDHAESLERWREVHATKRFVIKRTAFLYHQWQKLHAKEVEAARLAAIQHPYSYTSGVYTGDHLSLLLCIHSHEGAWDDPNEPFYGGLQFLQSTWLAWGGADWSWEQGVPFPFSSGYQLNIAEAAGDANGWNVAWLHSQWPKSSVLCDV